MNQYNREDMNSRSQRRALYDIPSLPDEILKQKYIKTDDIYDPRTVENYMKEVLRSTGPDAPLFEQDLPRKGHNPLSQSILNTQEHGGRYTHAPFHPELFLGDLTKDQRLSTTTVRTDQLMEQQKFRQSRYIHGKLQDVADVRTEGMVGNKRMLRQVKDGFNDTATRMGGIFDDSTNTMVSRANPNPGKTIHEVGDTLKEDQVIYQTGGEKILPKYGADPISKLSNMIGVNWQVQPDTKYKVSSVSNIYRAKQDVDKAATAVFRLGQQDTQFKSEQFNQSKSAPMINDGDKQKLARRNVQNVNVHLSKDSNAAYGLGSFMLPSIQASQVDRFVGTQSGKRQMTDQAMHYKPNKGGYAQESLVEPLTSDSGFNVTNHLSAPARDRLAISKQVQRETYRGRPAEKSNKHNAANKPKLGNADVSVDTRTIKEGMESVSGVLGMPQRSIDHVGNVRMTKSRFAALNEVSVSNPTGSNALPVVNTLNDFEFDTDPTMNNNYQTRAGVSQRMTKLTKLQDFDNGVSPLNDTIAPFRTNYSK